MVAGALSKDGLASASMPEAGVSSRTSYCWSYSTQTCVGESFPRLADSRTLTVRVISPKKCDQRRLRVAMFGCRQTRIRPSTTFA